MSMSSKSKQKFLFGLLALLGLSFFMNFNTSHTPATITKAPQKKIQLALNDTRDESVQLGLLNRQPIEFNEVNRNIFKYHESDRDTQAGGSDLVPIMKVPEEEIAQEQKQSSLPDV